ncbi:MAG: alkaline phosphatase [Verrucomicrobiales bacterium]|nr:alkaline phosphatase [Verrucomicrobiales bacterium]
MKTFSLVLLSCFAVQIGSTLELSKLSTLKLGAFDEGAAEMIDYDPVTKNVFSINGENKTVAVIDISDPTDIKLQNELNIADYGKSPTCVAVKNGLVAVTIRAEDKQAPGQVVFFKTDGEIVSAMTTGALPDNVIFSPDGKYCIIANEGEPSDDYTNDPEGSVTIVEIGNGMPKEAVVAGFSNIEGGEGVRVFGPNASLAQDLEPEFAAVSGDSKTAFVICQENNALAIVDLPTCTVKAVKSLGTKDHSKEGNGFDASNKTDAADIRTWPVKGLYLPDAILSYDVGGKGYLITANEGDARDYESYSEETRVEDLKLDPDKFPNAAELQDEKMLGRLKTTTTLGDTDGDGDVDEIYSFGARSFSIWDEEGNLVYDSGDEFEQILSKELGEGFNSTNDEQPSFKDRSDDKGPEPEALALGVVDGKTYAFIGLERCGGILVYDVTDPAAPTYQTFYAGRDFTKPIEEAGDLGPEDLEFIPASDSPNGMNLLISGNEVSGTVTVLEVK